MFTRFMSLFVLVTPLVSALTINAPTGVITGLHFNLSWLTAPDDPTNCTFELFNMGISFNHIIGSDVTLSSGFIILSCPDVPPSDSYGIQAFANGSVTPPAIAFAWSAMFSIGSFNYSVVTSPSSVSGSSSSSTGTCTASASTTPSSNSSTTIHRDAIIGGVIGGLVLISLLLVALFFFNRRSQAARNDTVPSFEVVNPITVLSSNPTSTFQSQDYTSNGQSESLPSQSISRHFTSSNPASMSSSDGFRPLAATPLRPLTATPLRRQFSPAAISPSSSRLHLTGLQTSLDYVPQAAMEPSMRRSPSPRGARYLRHEDSGVRISPTEDDVVELPPFYTSG